MTNRNKHETTPTPGHWSWSLPAAAVACVAAVAITAGCKKKPPPPPPAPPPPPREQPWESVQGMLDSHVDWPREREPATEDMAEAIAMLSNALARGDAQAMLPLLSEADRTVLQEMIDDGTWEEQTDGIEVVRINRIGSSSDKGATEVVLAIEDEDGAYLIGWRMIASGESFQFTGMDTPDTRADRATQLDPASQ